jgi:hypothetical protein
MQALIRLVARWDETFASAVRGASEEEVRALEHLAGRPLPDSYRDFLLTMGRSMGPFHPYDGNADLRIETVADYYRTTTWKPARDLLCIGREVGGSGTDYYLETVPGAAEPRVVLAVEGDDSFVPMEIYETFPNLLFHLAFLMLRMNRMKFRAELAPSGRVPWDERTSGKRVDAFGRLAEKHGFELVPNTRPAAAAYSRADAGLQCYQMPGFAPTFSASATSAEALDTIALAMVDKLALVRTR